MLIEFEFCTIFRPRESTKSGIGWLVQMAGAHLIVGLSQSQLEPDRSSLDFPVWTKASVHCALLILRQNDVNNNDSSIQFM